MDLIEELVDAFSAEGPIEVLKDFVGLCILFALPYGALWLPYLLGLPQ